MRQSEFSANRSLAETYNPTSSWSAGTEALRIRAEAQARAEFHRMVLHATLTLTLVVLFIFA